MSIAGFLWPTAASNGKELKSVDVETREILHTGNNGGVLLSVDIACMHKYNYVHRMHEHCDL